MPIGVETRVGEALAGYTVHLKGNTEIFWLVNNKKAILTSIITVHRHFKMCLKITVALNIFSPCQEAKVPNASINPNKLNVLKSN